jgi:hypothetical protein
MFQGINSAAAGTCPDDVGTIVQVTFTIHALTEAGVTQYLNGSPLEYAGADALQHMFSRMALKYDAVDLITMQDL